MNKKSRLRGNGYFVSEIYLIALFGLYALFSLVLVVMGIRVFENITASAGSNSEIRSSLFYTVNKIRSADLDSVSIELRDGYEVLVLESVYANETYETILYYDKGAIRELLMKKGDRFAPDRGETIIQTGGLAFSQTDHLIRITLTAHDGKTYSVSIHTQNR